MRREKLNMKKFLACVLALVMIFGLAANVSALEVGLGDTDIGDVTVNVTPGGIEHTYYIVVTWDSLTFQYTANAQRWDPDQKAYVASGEGRFANGTTANIQVTNKSDVAITVTATATDKDANDGFKATLNKTTFDLESYVDRGTADTNTFTVTVATNPAEGTPSNGGAVTNIGLNILEKS